MSEQRSDNKKCIVKVCQQFSLIG